MTTAWLIYAASGIIVAAIGFYLAFDLKRKHKH